MYTFVNWHLVTNILIYVVPLFVTGAVAVTQADACAQVTAHLIVHKNAVSVSTPHNVLTLFASLYINVRGTNEFIFCNFTFVIFCNFNC